MKQIIYTLFLVLLASSVKAQRPFITKWDTRITGTETTLGNQLQISTNDSEFPVYTYDYNVEWGDGTSDNNVKGNITHTYTTPGIYTVKISGTFPSIYFPDPFSSTSDAIKLLEVAQWGNIQWQTMNSAFSWCENLKLTATDKPDLSKVKSMVFMFFGCSKLNQPVEDWDVSHVEDMSGLFKGASNFNQPIGDWDVRKVRYMTQMFEAASSFNQPIGSWKTTSLLSMTRMFNDATAFNQDIGGWDVSNVRAMLQAFFNAESFNQDIGSWDVSNVTNMDFMFSVARAFNQDISGWDVSRVKYMAGMFEYTPFNQDISGWDVRQVLRFDGMFKGSDFNQNIGSWDLIEVPGVGSPSLNAIFDDSKMSPASYDTTLTGWASKTNIPRNVTLGAKGVLYSSYSEADRAKLINDFGWTINGDIKGVKIIFKDWDVTTLDTQVILSGADALTPSEPVRADYTFSGWDKSLKNILSDVTITAQYVAIGTASYKVTFKDWDGTVLKVETVKEKTNATPPVNPSRIGHTFNAWDNSYKVVKSDITLTALYTPKSSVVSFTDYNFTPLKIEYVDYGKDATPPITPTRTGYTFTGWGDISGNSEDYRNITEDKILIAQYSLITLTTGVVENESFELKAYPNPIIDVLHIKFDNSKKIFFDVLIYNSLGKLVRQMKYPNSRMDINMSNMKSGLYLIKVNGKTFKVIKK